MENKEKLAEIYAENKYPIDPNHDRLVQMCRKDTAEDFIAGYDACQEQADEFSKYFAEWICKNNDLDYTPTDLLKNYKQSLKQ